ncbi:hypothetical protein ACHQM5_011297 [Ranunculus cassubicifolius]
MDPALEASIDFQAWDKAWYSVHLDLDDDTLLVKYIGFPDRYNTTHVASSFKTPKDLDEFAMRFRPVSVQLQDNECYKVVMGMVVCASYEFGEEDVRFYDAAVVDVKRRDHKFLEGDCCTCSFGLYWLRGPNEGKETEAIVAHICLQQPGNALAHPTLSRFLEICKKRIEATSKKSGSATSKCPTPKNHTVPIVEHKASSPLLDSSTQSKELIVYKHSASTVRTSRRQRTDEGEGQIVEYGTKTLQNINTKEGSNVHFILIDNLENGTSPSTIVDFVTKHVSITSQALVFPTSSGSTYTRGVIVLKSKNEVLRLSNFLQNPAHMILSSKGRPWVVIETNMSCIPFVAAANGFVSEGLEVGGGIRIVKRGSEEYKRGKQLMGLFLEFAEHQQVLHKRFMYEESKILQF